MPNLNNLNRFEFAPTTLDIHRSRFHVPHTHKTTFTSGKLVPIGLFEVLPSDTFDLTLSNVTRMITPVVPVMDNCYLDVYAFFVPNRIATVHPKDWEKICGENVNGFWAPVNEATLENTGNMVSPSPVSSATLPVTSVGAYLGLPIGVPILDKVSILPLNGYRLIYNEWFRDQNTQPPVSSLGYTSNLLDVNKFHDYFTSCLPSPQKGAAVSLPIGDIAPVVTQSGDGIHVTSTSGQAPGYTDLAGNLTIGSSNNNLQASVRGTSTLVDVSFDNLVTDLSNATATTINQLRQAFAIQRMLEKDARGGSRYREILRTHYGSNIPDNTIQIPQYLGGKRIPLNITQVLQTSSSNETSPLGATGAFSNSSFSDHLFTKSFDEHGFIHVVACVRPNQTYSQGLSKLWTRNRRYDWYYPSFANLGEQPVYKNELVYSRDTAGQVFGYQEAWAEYRFIPNRVSGYLAPKAGDAVLNAWTYTSIIGDNPTLNSSFMNQPASQIGDTLVIDDSPYQFISDFYFNMNITRAMPTYSIPGLIDHH